MPDQAEKLRELIEIAKQEEKYENHQDKKEIEEEKHKNLQHSSDIKKEIFPLSHTSRVIAITSGKGGVGKTNIAVNLSILLAQNKKKVLLLDADMGLANIDVLLGIIPKFNLQHVIMGNKTLADIIITGPENIKIIPGATGIQELADLPGEKKEEFLQKINVLENLFDIILIDTGAGISSSVLSFVLASSEIVVVTTPEPTSIKDAYSVIKVIFQKNPEADIKLIVNIAESEDVAKKTIEKITTVASQFLNTSIEGVGYILYDKFVAKSVLQQRPFVLNYPYSIASRNLKDISSKLLNAKEGKEVEYKGISNFFRRLGFFRR